MAIKTSIIDIAHDVFIQIFTEIILRHKSKISESWVVEKWIQEQILASTIKLFNERENLSNYDKLVQEVFKEIRFLKKSLETEYLDVKVRDKIFFGENINQECISFISECNKLKTIVEKRKSELEQLEQQHCNSDCPPGWTQVKSPENINNQENRNTQELKFMEIQERIYNRRSGNTNSS